jgi:hypothetical protein
MRIWYFGCDNSETGHYLWDSDGKTRWDVLRSNPWAAHIDDGLNPKKGQGQAAIHHKNGWTYVSFSDYTKDRRPGSNAGFLVDAEVEFPEVMAMAEIEFPEILRRIGKVVLWVG